MLHKGRTYIVGDRVVVDKQQGTIKYIGELVSSKKIWIGIRLDAKKPNMKKKLLQQSTTKDLVTTTKQKSCSKTQNNEYIRTDGSIDGIVYIKNKNKQKNIIFVEASNITKWLKGVSNKHLSRTFHINQDVWIKSIKCKGIAKSMFYEPTKYIKQHIKHPLDREQYGKQYLVILLNQRLGNNKFIKKKIKYFLCEDEYDFFVKADRKQLIPGNEHNERLSAHNLELIIDHWFDEYFDDIHLAQELILLLISFFGAMDGTLELKEAELHKYKEHCLNFDDYYEYDSIYLGKYSRIIGGRLICIKCFGDLVIDQHAEISVSATVDIGGDAIFKINKGNKLKYGASSYSGGKGGGILKIICFGNVILRKNGLITANSGCGSGDSWGSGGSIYIKCDTLINYGKILARGTNATEPFFQSGYGATTAHWTWRYWQRSPAHRNGNICIDGKYTEDGSDRVDRFYCGPIIFPIQTHLQHQSKHW